jgi:hypothetical protein
MMLKVGTYQGESTDPEHIAKNIHHFTFRVTEVLAGNMGVMVREEGGEEVPWFGPPFETPLGFRIINIRRR